MPADADDDDDATDYDADADADAADDDDDAAGMAVGRARRHSPIAMTSPHDRAATVTRANFLA